MASLLNLPQQWAHGKQPRNTCWLLEIISWQACEIGGRYFFSFRKVTANKQKNFPSFEKEMMKCIFHKVAQATAEGVIFFLWGSSIWCCTNSISPLVRSQAQATHRSAYWEKDLQELKQLMKGLMLMSQSILSFFTDMFNFFQAWLSLCHALLYFQD